MDVAELEGIAVAAYKLQGLDPSEPVSPMKLARLELGPDVIIRAPLTVSGPAATFILNGVRRIAIKRTLPPAYARFYVGHELAHVWLEREGYREDDLEAACDYLGAAFMAPRPAVIALHRAHGFDLAEVAKVVGSTQTWWALRVGEVHGVPLAAISRATVRVRGPDEWVWPDAVTIRGWARRPRPGLRKVEITDDRGRVALVGGED